MGKKIAGAGKRLLGRVHDQAKTQKRRVLNFIDRRPFATFLVALGILLAFIIASNILGTPKIQEKEPVKQVKPVHVYSIGTAPKLKVQAQIEKSGVLRITSLTAGVVQKANKREGETFKKGDTLVSLSTNYQGGSTPSLQRQLAQSQYNNALETHKLQKEIIEKQRDIAEVTDENNEELREITEKSIGETQNLISANDDVLTAVNNQIQVLESTNVGGANDAAIINFKAMRSQFISANNQARQGLRQAEYQADDDNPPAELSELSKELTLKQLDLQKKMLDLNKEISRIQLNIAQVTEAMMYPSAPFNGTVQQVLVKEGEAVNPGTELMIISQNLEDDPTLAIAYIPQEVASKVSLVEPSILSLNGKETLHLQPSYVSQDAVRGTLHAVYFTIPTDYIAKVTEAGFIEIQLPIGYANTTTTVPYVPIDAVYQTKESNYLYVIRENKAVSQKVTLGNVFGSFVEIVAGLQGGDKIITDRNVIAGDTVRIAN